MRGHGANQPVGHGGLGGLGPRLGRLAPAEQHDPGFVATEHALDFKTKAADAGTAPVEAQQEAPGTEDELEKRLQALRG